MALEGSVEVVQLEGMCQGEGTLGEQQEGGRVHSRASLVEGAVLLASSADRNPPTPGRTLGLWRRDSNGQIYVATRQATVPAYLLKHS